MASTGKADHKHRLVDARVLDGSHRAAQDCLKALSRFLTPMRARENMHVAAQGDHGVAGPFLVLKPSGEPGSRSLHPPIRRDHDALSCR